MDGGHILAWTDPRGEEGQNRMEMGPFGPTYGID